jgi:hypothetical protein
MRDSRWPFLPFIILRPKQLLLSIIILGLTAFVISSSIISFWFASIGLFTSIATLLWSIITIVLYYTNHLLPLAAVIVDAFLTLFWLISFAGTASSGLLAVDCTNYELISGGIAFLGDDSICEVIKGAFAIEFIAFLSLVVSLVLSSLTLHRTRHDLTGQNHAAGLDANGNYEEEGVVPEQTVVPMYPVGQEHQLQQPQPVYVDTTVESKPGQFLQQSMQPTYYPEQPTPTQIHMDPGTLVEEEGQYNGDIGPSHCPGPVHEAPVSHTPAPGQV